MNAPAALSPQMIGRMQELLAQDNVAGLEQEFGVEQSGDVLTQWVLDNAMHALGNCPVVMQEWPVRGKAQALYRRVAWALEGLDEDDKTRLLRGQAVRGPAHPAHTHLYQYVKQMNVHWFNLSPLWVGEAGSPLRAAALALRWEPKHLPAMVKTCMDHNKTWQTWLSRVPYLYSIRVCHWIAMQRIFDLTPLASEHANRPGEELRMVAAANPMDAALAQHILALSPVAFKHRLVVHPDMLPVSHQDSERLRTLVQVYMTMGLFPLSEHAWTCIFRSLMVCNEVFKTNG